MKLPVVWLAAAADELQGAVSWYTDIRPELGARFINQIEETVQAIASSPSSHAAVDGNRRRASVRRFPYGIFFIEEPDRILIIACFHGKRNPSHWQSRH